MSRGTNIKSSANFRFKSTESVFKSDFKLKFVDFEFDFEVATGTMSACMIFISGPNPGGGGGCASNLLLRRPGLMEVIVVVIVSVTVSGAVVVADKLLDGQSMLESVCSERVRLRAPK